MTVFRFVSIAVSILALGSSLAPTAAVAQTTSLPIVRRIAQQPSPVTAAALEQEAYRQINVYRASKKLPKLTWNDKIAAQARQHSQGMATKKVAFGHVGFSDRSKAIGIVYSRVAENVAYNQGYADPVTQAVQGWLKSSGHKANIEGAYNLTGIGAAQNAQGEVFFTQIFLNSR
jgi:uncharacterized protein YkwD